MAIIPNGRQPPPASSNCWSFQTFSLSFFAGLVAFAFMSIYIADQSIQDAMSSYRIESKANFPLQTDKTAEKSHPLAGLSCETHGGPSAEQAKEMVYWQDIPTDRYDRFECVYIGRSNGVFDLLKSYH